MEAASRFRKISWTKSHSVLEESQKVELKRSGSMNNIILGWKTETEKNNEKQRKRSYTVRQKKKNGKSKGGSDAGGPLKDACVHIANLNILSPLITTLPVDVRCRFQVEIFFYSQTSAMENIFV